MREHRNSSCDVAPVRTPPPGRRGEAMLSMQVLGDFLGGLRGVRRWAAVRVSVVIMRILRSFGDEVEDGDAGCCCWCKERLEKSSLRSTDFLDFRDRGCGGSSGTSRSPLTFLRPWPLRLIYAASSCSSSFFLPEASAALTGAGSTMSSLLSTPRFALAIEASKAGIVLLMTCFACFARMSFRTAGGARPWDFSVRPISSKQATICPQ